MKTDALKVEIDQAIAYITLTNPTKLNPLSPAALSDLIEAAAYLNHRPEIRVAIIAGEGRAFCGGADLAVFADPELGAQAGDLGRQMADAIEGIAALTIAGIHGHCIGGGIVLAAACDFRIAADDTTFIIPEVDLGIPLAWGGIPRLVREIGPAATRDLVLTCRPFTAQEAWSVGFLTSVTAPDDLTSDVKKLSESLALKSQLVVAQTLNAIRSATEELSSTANAAADTDRLLAAMVDDESTQLRKDYLRALGR